MPNQPSILAYRSTKSSPRPATPFLSPSPSVSRRNGKKKALTLTRTQTIQLDGTLGGVFKKRSDSISTATNSIKSFFMKFKGEKEKEIGIRGKILVVRKDGSEGSRKGDFPDDDGDNLEGEDEGAIFEPLSEPQVPPPDLDISVIQPSIKEIFSSHSHPVHKPTVLVHLNTDGGPTPEDDPPGLGGGGGGGGGTGTGSGTPTAENPDPKNLKLSFSIPNLPKRPYTAPNTPLDTSPVMFRRTSFETSSSNSSLGGNEPIIEEEEEPCLLLPNPCKKKSKNNRLKIVTDCQEVEADGSPMFEDSKFSTPASSTPTTPEMSFKIDRLPLPDRGRDRDSLEPLGEVAGRVVEAKKEA